jgi:hypothetical protein
MKLVENKIVNIKELKYNLIEKYKDVDMSRYEDKKDFDDCVDIDIQEMVEEPAFEDYEELNGVKTQDIYNVIDNIDEFRDCVRDFINSYDDYFETSDEFGVNAPTLFADNAPTGA